MVTKQAAKKAALVQRQSKVPLALRAPFSHQRSPYKAQGAQRMSISRSPSLRRESRRPRPTSRSRSPQQLHHQGWSDSPSDSRGRRMSPLSPPQPLSHDPSLSPSPSPRVVGRKRSRSPKRSHSPSEPFVKAQKVSEGGGRPKASDYDEVAKEVILHATAIYRCLVSTSNAFPTPSEEGEMIKAAWNRANDETLQEVPIALTPVIAKVVSRI